VCCGEAEAWRKEVPESLVTMFKSNHHPEVLGPNAPFLCTLVLHFYIEEKQALDTFTSRYL